MSEYLVAQIARVANVSILLGTQVQEPLGNQALEAVAVADNQTGALGVIRALFVFIGASSCAGWLGDLVDLDDHRFAMSAAARPSGWPQPSARVRWRSGSPWTECSQRCHMRRDLPGVSRSSIYDIRA
jgi:hypothetical protein